MSLVVKAPINDPLSHFMDNNPHIKLYLGLIKITTIVDFLVT